MANAPKDAEENFSGSKAWPSAASPEEGERENFGSEGRRLAKIRITLAGLSRSKLWAERSQDIYPVHAVL